MTDAIGQAWYDEASDEQKSRMWRQRGSNGLGTGAPPPSRYVEETDVVLPASELGAGATVTMQRHVHEWSVPEPMMSIVAADPTVTSVFNVLDYGALGDGAMDDTTAILAAITAATATKGIVYLPSGTYLVSSRVEIPAGVTLMGAGMAGTIVKRHSLSPTELLYLPHAQSGIGNLTVDSSWDTLGNLVGVEVWLGGVDSWAERITVRNFSFIGVGLHGTRPTLRDAVVIGNAAANSGASGVDGYIGVWADQPNCESPAILNTHIRDVQANGIFAGSLGARIIGNRLTDCHRMDDVVAGGQLCVAEENGGEGAVIVGNSLDGTNGGEATYGIEISMNGVVVANNSISNHGRHGIFLQIGTDHQVMGNLVRNSGMGAGGGSGIVVDTNISGVQIQNNRCYDDQGTKTQAYGISVTAGTSTNYIISGNDLRDNLTGALFDGGTGVSKIIANNLPLVPLVVRAATGYGTVDLTGPDGGSLDFRHGASYVGSVYADTTGIAIWDEGGGAEALRIAATTMLATFAGSVATPGLSLTDGVTAPGAVVGKAQLYVDTSDGDLKCRFGDGTIKTIVVDT